MNEQPPVELLGLTRSKLAAALAPIIDRPFRVGQIYDAIHVHGVRSLEAITTLRKDLREQLAQGFAIGVPEIAALHASSDGTRKFLFSLVDGATIEAVDIPDRGRHTLCVSSQAGCALACRFCVTGFWGAGRNLTVGEIVAQVYAIRFGTPPLPPSLNLVFMGMGEPLLNLENLREALEILSQEISLRRITVSTAGVVPGIDAMAAWERRPNLAVSLHAPDDERRDRIMPINKSYPIASLLEALERFPLEKGRRITFEIDFRIRHVRQHEHVVLFRERDSILVEIQIGHLSRGVGRVARHHGDGRWRRMAHRATDARKVLLRRMRLDGANDAARHDEAEGVDRIGWVWRDDHVARRGDGLGKVGEAFLRAERGDDLSVGVQLYAEAAIIISGHRLAQTANAS